MFLVPFVNGSLRLGALQIWKLCFLRTAINEAVGKHLLFLSGLKDLGGIKSAITGYGP